MFHVNLPSSQNMLMWTQFNKLPFSQRNIRAVPDRFTCLPSLHKNCGGYLPSYFWYFGRRQNDFFSEPMKKRIDYIIWPCLFITMSLTSPELPARFERSFFFSSHLQLQQLFSNTPKRTLSAFVALEQLIVIYWMFNVGRDYVVVMVRHVFITSWILTGFIIFRTFQGEWRQA